MWQHSIRKNSQISRSGTERFHGQIPTNNTDEKGYSLVRRTSFEHFDFRSKIINWMNINFSRKRSVKFVSNHYGELITKDISVDVSTELVSAREREIFVSLDCQQAYHRECVINCEKCSKDRVKTRKISHNRNPSSKWMRTRVGACRVDFPFALRISFCG